MKTSLELVSLDLECLAPVKVSTHERKNGIRQTHTPKRVPDLLEPMCLL